MLYIVPIVEGHGEVEAVPELLRRIATNVLPGRFVKINHPIRIKASSFLNDDAYFTKQLILAAAKAAQAGGFVLILLDCEDECPAHLGPRILRKAVTLRSDIHFIVALAYREYESWFLSAATSLGGMYGLPAELEPPSKVESIRDAKGWLSDKMDRKYDEVTHQLEFSRKFDMEAARTSRSFNRFYERISAALMMAF